MNRMRCALVSGPAGSGIGAGGGTGGRTRVSVRGAQTPRSMRRRPFSGCCGPFGDHDKEVSRILETLKNGEASGLPLKYMFCGNGDKDIAYAEHTDIMGKVLPQCPQLKPGENYDFYVIPGGVHDMKAWQLHLYHALQVFFK